MTPFMCGEVPIHFCRKVDNVDQFRQECQARGLIEADGDKVGYQQIQRMIKEHVRKEWMTANPGMEIPDVVGKHSEPVSTARFKY